MQAATGSARASGSIPPRHDPAVLVIVAILLTTLATAWALALKPLPFSDWAYYWEAAQGTASYERGGVLLFALRGLQALELPPYAAALAMNLTAALAMLMLAYRADGGRTRAVTAIVTVYLLAIAPYFSVVQFDLPATALLCAGLCLLAPRRSRRRRPWPTIAGMVLVSFAVSSRPQFLLVLIVYGLLLASTPVFARRFHGVIGNKVTLFAIALTAAALVGFALDSALRANAGRTNAVRTNSAVTLYAGLLSSGTSPPTCGHWIEQAARDARADAGLPLARAVSRRLEQQPLRHWLAVVACKAPNIILPGPYALSWSLGAPNVVADLEASAHAQRLDAWRQRFYLIERFGFRALLAVIYAFAAVVILRRLRDRRWLSAWLPSLWIASYWLVHSVFEIQARYFLSLFLILPFLTTGGIIRLFDKAASAGTPPRH